MNLRLIIATLKLIITLIELMNVTLEDIIKVVVVIKRMLIVR